MEGLDDKNPGDNDGWTPLHSAAKKGNCEFIIERLQDKNPPNHNGYKPLQTAAINGHFNVCKLMCKTVSIVVFVNNSGRTPIKFTVFLKHCTEV